MRRVIAFALAGAVLLPIGACTALAPVDAHSGAHTGANGGRSPGHRAPAAAARAGVAVPVRWAASGDVESAADVDPRGVAGQDADHRPDRADVGRRASDPPDADRLDADWWRAFGSAELDALIARARAANHDVAAAAARVAQARARSGIAAAGLRPVVDASAEATRVAAPGGSRDGDERIVDGFALGLAARYEVDLWGRLDATRRAAFAAELASEFDRRTVELTVIAEVARCWLLAVGTAQRERIADANRHSAQRLLDLVEARMRAGHATALDVAQQRRLVAAQARAVLRFAQQQVDARLALATLLGLGEPVVLATDSLASVSIPSVPAGVPSSLLDRRPDLARAEAELAAADADVQAARAALRPSLMLGAGLGSGGERLLSWFDRPLYSLAASLVAPVFDGGRRRSQVALTIAQREQSLQVYRKTVVAAFADVQAALNQRDGYRRQARVQADELALARESLRLAESRYRAGAESMLTLLTAQRALQLAEDEEIALRIAQSHAALALYRSLGGGWSIAEATAGP
ncbi:MAG: efflux transporter outer membrane subunit [Burkholderiaceae bacterium]